MGTRGVPNISKSEWGHFVHPLWSSANDTPQGVGKWRIWPFVCHFILHGKGPGSAQTQPRCFAATINVTSTFVSVPDMQGHLRMRLSAPRTTPV